jgi:hypothetical protein
MNQLDVRNLLVVSVPQKSEEQLLYNPIWVVTISNQCLNGVFSYAFPG